MDGETREAQSGTNINLPLFMDQKTAADLLGLSPRTLERFRLEGRGPIYRKFGRRCLYHRDDVLAWADAQARASTSDPDPQDLRD